MRTKLILAALAAMVVGCGWDLRVEAAAADEKPLKGQALEAALLVKFEQGEGVIKANAGLFAKSIMQSILDLKDGSEIPKKTVDGLTFDPEFIKELAELMIDVESRSGEKKSDNFYYLHEPSKIKKWFANLLSEDSELVLRVQRVAESFYTKIADSKLTDAFELLFKQNNISPSNANILAEGFMKCGLPFISPAGIKTLKIDQSVVKALNDMIEQAKDEFAKIKKQKELARWEPSAVVGSTADFSKSFNESIWGWFLTCIDDGSRDLQKEVEVLKLFLGIVNKRFENVYVMVRNTERKLEEYLTDYLGELRGKFQGNSKQKLAEKLARLDAIAKKFNEELKNNENLLKASSPIDEGLRKQLLNKYQTQALTQRALLSVLGMACRIGLFTKLSSKEWLGVHQEFKRVFEHLSTEFEAGYTKVSDILQEKYGRFDLIYYEVKAGNDVAEVKRAVTAAEKAFIALQLLGVYSSYADLLIGHLPDSKVGSVGAASVQEVYFDVEDVFRTVLIKIPAIKEKIEQFDTEKQPGVNFSQTLTSDLSAAIVYGMGSRVILTGLKSKIDACKRFINQSVAQRKDFSPIPYPEVEP